MMISWLAARPMSKTDDGDWGLWMLGMIEVVGAGLMTGGIIKYRNSKRAADMQGYSWSLPHDRKLTVESAARFAIVGQWAAMRLKVEDLGGSGETSAVLDIRIDGKRAGKTSEEIRVGSAIALPLHGRVRVIRVAALPSRRGPAAEAKSCYEEIDPTTRTENVSQERASD